MTSQAPKRLSDCVFGSSPAFTMPYLKKIALRSNLGVSAPRSQGDLSLSPGAARPGLSFQEIALQIGCTVRSVTNYLKNDQK